MDASPQRSSLARVLESRDISRRQLLAWLAACGPGGTAIGYLAGNTAHGVLGDAGSSNAMVNLSGSDVYGHKFGALESGHIMASVVAGQDREIGRIVRAYRDAGLFHRTLATPCAQPITGYAS